MWKYSTYQDYDKIIESELKEDLNFNETSQSSIDMPGKSMAKKKSHTDSSVNISELFTRFNLKIKKSTHLQVRLNESIARETKELTNIFTKLESSSCYGKVMVSLNFISSKDYSSPKVMLNKEHLNIYNKFQNYKFKFTKAYALLTEKYFEFYTDEHMEKEIFKIERETLDVVALGIRTVVKPNVEVLPERKTVVKRRAKVFGESSAEETRKFIQTPGFNISDQK